MGLMQGRHPVVALAASGLLLLAAGAPAASAAGEPVPSNVNGSHVRVRPGDVDGDRLGDLAIAATAATVGGQANAGAVGVVYGSRGGLDLEGLDLARSAGFTQNTPGVAGSAEASDWFGTALLFRDLTGDWRSDLVIGSPGENDLAGLVHVLNGSRGGVTANDSIGFGPRWFGIAPRPPDYAFFGITFG